MKAGLVLMGAESGASNNSTFHAQIALQSQSGIKSAGLLAQSATLHTPVFARAVVALLCSNLHTAVFHSAVYKLVVQCGSTVNVVQYANSRFVKLNAKSTRPIIHGTVITTKIANTIPPWGVKTSIPVYNLVYFTDPLS